jgi:hypothetical protein
MGGLHGRTMGGNSARVSEERRRCAYGAIVHEGRIRGGERGVEGAHEERTHGYLVSVRSGKGVCGAETTCEGEDAREGWKWLVNAEWMHEG